MVNTGKTITFTGEFQTVALKIIEIKKSKGLGDVDISKTTNGLNLYASVQDINIIRAELLKRGFSFEISTDAPIKNNDNVDLGPTAEEAKALSEMIQAKKIAMEKERDRLWQLIEDEYNIIKTTNIGFRRFTDFKHLRGD